MKHIRVFDIFLKDVVNLNQTRIDVATSAIDTMRTFLENNDVFKAQFLDAVPQGSYRQGTIIKPVNTDLDFDVDLLLELESIEGWEAQDYLVKLSNEFKKTARYKDKVDNRGKTRCVTIDYESDFHVDLIPSITTPGGRVIMNRKENSFEPTDGDGYAKWFEGKNRLTGGKHLTKTVRLLKYIRDSQEKFEVKSILLTTLVGQQVLDTDDASRDYADIPTSFVMLLGRLDTYLQENSFVPKVTNPVLSSEDFNRHWNQEKYSRFRDNIHSYAQKAVEAYNEPDESRSLKKWQEVFGQRLSSSGPANLVPQPKIQARDVGEEFLKDFGIPEEIDYSLRINAWVDQHGFRPFTLRGTRNPLSKRRKLKFFIESSKIPKPYAIKWKIKNTGEEARTSGDLRGKILDDAGFEERKEDTKYAGAHYVECYVLKDGICVAKDRLDVPVESFNDNG